MMTMLLPIAFVLILLAVAAALVVVLVRSCTLPRRVVKGACCGGCGYAFTGWSICPECGSAVTDVGVETPRIVLRYRGSVALAACVLFLLALFGGLMTFGGGLALFDHLGYERRIETATLNPAKIGVQPNYFAHFASDAEIGPRNMHRAGETLLAIEIAPPTAASPAASDARVAIARNCPHLRLNLSNKSYEIVQPRTGEVTVGEQLDAVAIRSFLVNSGVNVANVDLDRAAAELAQSLKSGSPIAGMWPSFPPATGRFAFIIHSESSSRGPASPVRFPGLSSFATWTLFVAVSFLVLFFLALRFVIRRRRRLLAIPAKRDVAIPTPTAPAAPAERS